MESVVSHNESPGLSQRAIPLRSKTVRPLKKSQGTTVVKRLSVGDLKNGQDFNQFFNLNNAPSQPPHPSPDNGLKAAGAMANSLRDAGDLANQDPRTLSRLRNEANSEANIAAKSATNNLANSETSSATNSEANNAANSEALNVATSDQAISPRPKTATNEAAAAESLLAESAGQRAMGRYFGRKTQGAAASLRNKGSDLTEEEKIGQLKKIKQSAEDYEGLLMKEMIKSLRQSPFVKTAGSETYSEIAEKPFTAALTAAGGLGLSEKIVADVARQEGLTETLKEHPEIMGPNYRAKISPSRMRKAPTLYNQGQ